MDFWNSEESIGTTLDYSSYVNLYNNVGAPQFDILFAYLAADKVKAKGELEKLKKELEKRHVAVAVKEFSKTEETDLSLQHAKLYLAMISEKDFESLYQVLGRRREQFIPVPHSLGLDQLNGGEASWLKLARQVLGLLIEHQIKEVSEELLCRLHLLLQQVKIHYYQCTILVQKMLAAEDILKHVKLHLNMEVYGVFKHILLLLKRSKALLLACTVRFWLITALFKFENEEFGELISGLEEYCVLLIDLIFAEDVSDDLKELRFSMMRKPITSLSSCAEKDRQCLIEDITGHKPQAHELGLVKFLIQRLRHPPGAAIDEHLLIESKDVKRVKYLARGWYNVVHEVKWNNIGLAMKVSGSKERRILASLRHPNVVTMVGYLTAKDDEHRNEVSSIIMECMKSFPDFLRKGQLPFSTFVDIILQIARAMHWLHEKDIIHRDLKPSNILVNSDNPLCKYIVVKVADFRSAKQDFQTSKTASVDKGTYGYMAPELQNSQRHYNRKADVYSYGQTCRYILTGNLSQTNWDSNVPDCLAKYLNSCVDDEPDKRPSFGQICEVLELIKKADLIGIICAVNQAFNDYSVGTFRVDNFQKFSNTEMTIIKAAALAMLRHPTAKKTTKETTKRLKGWLVVDQSITPELFKEIPNPNFMDGTQFILKSIMLQKYISLSEDEGLNAKSKKDSEAEKFKLWRYTESKFFIRSSNFKFVAASRGSVKCHLYWTDNAQLFEIISHPQTDPKADKVRVQVRGFFNHDSTRSYLKVEDGRVICPNIVEEPTWEDNSSAVFEMTILQKMGGEYQLVNGYGYDKASQVLKKHWNTFVTRKSFEEYAQQQISVVQIPVGWWITHPQVPFVEGSLAHLDNAFTWANEYNIKIIIELQASPGYRDGNDGPDLILRAKKFGLFEMVETSSRIMPMNFYGYSHGLGPRANTFDAMNTLHKRYGKHPALLRAQLIQNHYENWSFGQEI